MDFCIPIPSNSHAQDAQSYWTYISNVTFYFFAREGGPLSKIRKKRYPGTVHCIEWYTVYFECMNKSIYYSEWCDRNWEAETDTLQRLNCKFYWPTLALLTNVWLMTISVTVKVRWRVTRRCSRLHITGLFIAASARKSSFRQLHYSPALSQCYDCRPSRVRRPLTFGHCRVEACTECQIWQWPVSHRQGNRIYQTSLPGRCCCPSGSVSV